MKYVVDWKGLAEAREARIAELEKERDELRETVAYEIKNAAWEAERAQKAEDRASSYRLEVATAEARIRRLENALRRTIDALDRYGVAPGVSVVAEDILKHPEPKP